jgi:hypothetical protein
MVLRMLWKQALLDMARDLQFALGILALLGTVRLLFDGGEKARVVPRLLNKIHCSAAHGFHREVHARPRGHDDDGSASIVLLKIVEQGQAFIARRGVARVVHVHQDQIEP